ncbi:unnamed protein product [Lymnaea stagnalis]|uniref:Receptor protein-tyrosine kinase n=1 Tax=Lymnaea stagnalis TaxID=6523 RepID=A0AAV2I526_LYMST
MPDFSHLIPSCHVVCLLLVLSVKPSDQQRCGERAVCRGERPQLSNGCCPVEPGQMCRPGLGDNCDTELGFTCRDDAGALVTEGQGWCRGLHNLTVTSRGLENLTLAWAPYAPADYMFEYILLYREGGHHYDVNKWHNRDIGDQPRYTLKKLSPGTLYLIKVALWTNQISNVTETIMADTLPVEFCEHDGGIYQVGAYFLHDCEDNCTCLPTGEFSCTAVCPELGMPELPDETCHVVLSDSCCEYRTVCPVGGEPCAVGNTSYPHGDEFQVGCRTCACDNREVRCQYPESCYVMEATQSCPNPKSRDVEGECCPEWYCESTCTYENRTYTNMEYFTSTHCGLCQCNANDGVQCASDCPPVAMVLPDAACPDPHIRQDGCCETLYCHDPSADISEFLRRMFALSYSPVTLTLSFEVNPQVTENGLPSFSQYEILYANTSDPHGSWQSRTIQPVDVRLQHDQPSHVEPTAALSRDSAIVVNNRAYVTLGGMHPNTMYYVKIFPLDSIKQDMGDATLAAQHNKTDRNVSVMVVVRTKSLENVTSCFHDGREVFHQEEVLGHCNQTCTCYLGKITCRSRCDSELYVMAASPTCPKPSLEKRDGECCPLWMCHPSASGCSHKGLILTSGQSVTEDCQVCACDNASLHCSSVCPPLGHPPRPGCEAANISGHCCAEWQCPQESHPPYGVKSSILLHLYGSCLAPVSKFAEKLQQRLLGHVTSQTADLELSELSASLDVKVLCPGVNNNDEFIKGRRRRSAADAQDKIPAIVSVSKNFSSDRTDQQTIQLVHTAGLELLAVLNTSFAITLDSGQSMKSADDVILQGLSYTCDHGFAFVKDKCVLSEIESPATFSPNVKLTAVASASTFVTLEWSFPNQELKDIHGLIIEYRSDGSIPWLASDRLDVYTSSYNLTGLTPDRDFTARLVVITLWSGNGRWTVGEVSFRTNPDTDSLAMSSDVNLREVTVSENHVYIFWDPLPSNLLIELNSVTIFYKKSYTNSFNNKLKVTSTNLTQAQLADLQPDTAYTAVVAMLLESGETVTSSPIYFVTKYTRPFSRELLVAVIISCIATLVSAIVVALTCYMWRRSKRKSAATGFENKTYGIPLENNNEGIPAAPSANPASN